jgi:hypothetical protein
MLAFCLEEIVPLNHVSKYARLTDKHFRLIGQVVVEWANIEFLQKIILSRLLLSPEFPSRIYTDLISAARLQNGLGEAISIHRHHTGRPGVNHQ